MSNPVAGIILAAGKGTRMKSDLPKGLHPVLGLPMVELIGRAMKRAGVERPIIVIGHGGEEMIETLGESYDYAWQREQRGTGHATMMAAEFLKDHKGPVLIAPGDAPLLSSETLKELVDRHEETRAKCTLATSFVDDPIGYGRVVRDGAGRVAGVVEHKDATLEQHAIKEVSAGVYCFDAATLLATLPTLKNDNAQGEYYLPDALGAIYHAGGDVVALIVQDHEILMGVNDRWQLAQAEKALRARVNRRHALAGVTIVDPDSTYIGLDVTIGPDTTIEPNTYLQGATVIGSGCHIGPCTKIKGSRLGNGVNVYFSQVVESDLRDGVKVGPFSNIRPETVLGVKTKIGNFVEIKKSTLGEAVAVSHLTYIGDATVGDLTNVGAGTITCNYDGFSKHQTTIGRDVFVGSNSTLVAPVTIEDGSMVAAGSVVTHNVPADALALGRARQEVKEGWVSRWRKKKRSESQR
ncbi:MAG TPA: bifunctional UDP-N-acetylglucosamine diphosphorylase/glucosamine-1-phosphate N-acetyltransferase GlmU [Fimbriimonadaceae bacterium]|nr:bifunctional UDP-N-acetylglucosamine diphosphorylase/glucosamine-1-phosphate N-acetyltransferase GlmU [Fimbriimonadaceae bacterium]